MYLWQWCHSLILQCKWLGIWTYRVWTYGQTRDDQMLLDFQRYGAPFVRRISAIANPRCNWTARYRIPHGIIVKPPALYSFPHPFIRVSGKGPIGIPTGIPGRKPVINNSSHSRGIIPSRIVLLIVTFKDYWNHCKNRVRSKLALRWIKIDRDQTKQKAVANCVWMLVVKIKGIERIY